jgi:ADP-ribose pyrophosphatase YjhB (NUDIX family)
VHHIQRKILSQLMFAKSLGYAQMRPAGVESNHFAYHLEQLMRAGLIAKDERSYTLTSEGLALADRLSHDNMAVRVQPHIVTSIHLTNDAGQTLLYRHAFQPYLDVYGVPQGRLHYEEHIAQAAARELEEKAGLTDIPLTHRGMAYVYTSKKGVDVSKILIHVFSGTVTGTPALAGPTSKGVCSWVDPAKLSKAAWMPGYQEIRKLLADNPSVLFFAEIETEL